ncbi:MAG: ABC transporter permease, partial [Bacteroidota bacterium]
IRKILGAKISQIVIMLNKKIAYLIVIACFISAPTSWLIMQNWLADFPYRTTPGADVFLISIVIACMLAAFTVSYHSLKASLTKPVENLKND